MDKSKVAILMLACRDYEALELSLACHMAYGNRNVPFFILQNGRGDYDAERTLQVAHRYSSLFPETIRVIDSVPPNSPYASISTVLQSNLFSGYDLVLKVDDDVFPIAPGWVENLVACFQQQKQIHGSKLAYVTPLINNNIWGFEQTINAMGIADRYFAEVSRPHCVGSGHGNDPVRVIPADQINVGTCGTIWRYPYIARWIHQETTLQPDRFVAATAGLSPVEFPSKERYSIGCIMFEKNLWATINDGGTDDEHMVHMHCLRNALKVICCRSVPFVHLAYFTQKEENRDLMQPMRDLYQKRTGHPFPISLYSSKELDIESRLRWIEKRLSAKQQ
jgi:hypothetical protein